MIYRKNIVAPFAIYLALFIIEYKILTISFINSWPCSGVYLFKPNPLLKTKSCAIITKVFLFPGNIERNSLKIS
jgi:hypothetical protein